jgi:hypothetical protein
MILIISLKISIWALKQNSTTNAFVYHNYMNALKPTQVYHVSAVLGYKLVSFLIFPAIYT